MTTEQQQQLQAQKEQWGKSAAGWLRGHDKRTAMSREATELIIAEAEIAPGMRVLDLASGSGEPALTVAERVGASGHVTASDLTPAMLEGIRANAERAGLTNMSFEEVNIEQIPFDDGSFDRVTCRFGIMFVPDVVRGLSEIRRVLRPGGRTALVVFSAVQRNPFVGEINGVLARRGYLQPPPPDAPGMFRFQEAGSLSSRMRAAGFPSPGERAVPVSWNFPGTVDEYLDLMLDGTPVGGAVRALAEPEQSEVMAEIRSVVGARHSGGAVRYDAEVIVASADR